MLQRWKNWKRRRVLRRHAIEDALWQRGTASLPLLQGLDADELARLRRATTLFLHEKRFYGAQGMAVSEEMALHIAVQACLLTLNLDFDLYRGWSSIILYPDTFVVPREDIDEAGVVHSSRHETSGESWETGPLVLSWADAAPGVSPHGPGTNVIVHEFAHKLDMLNGIPNGLPPLHHGMDIDSWSADFTAAYEQLIETVERGMEPPIDPYATQDPAEFFAVASEYFFAAPAHLQEVFPAVYKQLVSYYRQDPAGRQRTVG